MSRSNRILFLLTAAGCVTTAVGQPNLRGRFGTANVGGQNVLVHVTVAVPPGLGAGEVAEEALRGLGARPIQPAEFSLTGLKWPGSSGGGAPMVAQSYNDSGEPLPAGGAVAFAQGTWTNVSWGGTQKSAFALLDGGSTATCPSLVKECPGPQYFDGQNGIGWFSIQGCCTLAVTWFGTGPQGPEADVGINSRFEWTTGGGSGYNLKTVLVHEFGHVLGLGHSSVPGSIMLANYAGPQLTLGIDDARGVTYLYPAANGVDDITGTVKSNAAGNPAIVGASVSIGDFPAGPSATSGDGSYTLVGVPTIGTYAITASADGYNSGTLADVAAGSTQQDFLLSPSSGGGNGGAECVPRGKSGVCK